MSWKTSDEEDDAHMKYLHLGESLLKLRHFGKQFILFNGDAYTDQISHTLLHGLFWQNVYWLQLKPGCLDSAMIPGNLI